MVKTYQNLELFGSDFDPALSILESRKYKQAGTELLSRRLQARSTPQRIGQCRKAGLFTRGLRKSSSLTNGIGRARNKAPLKEYGTEARGLYLSYNFVFAPILGNFADTLSIASRRRH